MGHYFLDIQYYAKRLINDTKIFYGFKFKTTSLYCLIYFYKRVIMLSEDDEDNIEKIRL